MFNGLTDEFHPTQMLADVLTMIEHCGQATSSNKLCILVTHAITWGILFTNWIKTRDGCVFGAPKALLPEPVLLNVKGFSKEKRCADYCNGRYDKAVRGVGFCAYRCLGLNG